MAKAAKKDPKRVRRYHQRCQKITQAHLIYRAVLRAVVGWSDFQNIDANATSEHKSLYEAAMEWPNEVWND